MGKYLEQNLSRNEKIVKQAKMRGSGRRRKNAGGLPAFSCMRFRCGCRVFAHSHSMVAGGLVVMS